VPKRTKESKKMELEIITRMSKDIRAAAVTLSDDEARFLVDAYYQMQDDRIRSNNQVRSLEKNGEPNQVVNWLAEQSDTLECQIKGALDRYSLGQPVGQWMRSQKGIGPVIAAGFLAHIDITKAETAGALWRYAGLDPTVEWSTGEKRPWNASLKTLCWKLGESFVKVSGMDDAFYGKLYAERKLLETQKNEAGEFAEQAKAKLEKFKIGKSTDAYKAYSIGKLPPAHIHARAKRYAVKIFISHLFDVWYREEHGKEPPKPFALAHLDHVHMIKVPNQPKRAKVTN
jgi:hypothetical protein